MTTPQLMAFVPTGSVGASDSGPAFYDWQRNLIYTLTGGSASNSGLHQFDGYATGNETLAKTIAQLGISAIHFDGGVLTQSGYLVGNEFTSNSTTLWEAFGLTGSLVNQFGISSASLAPSTGTRILTPGSMARLRWGNTDYVISCPLVSGFGEICIMTIPGLSNTNLGAITENRGYCGPGVVGPISGTAFVLGVGGTTNLGLYKVTATQLSTAMARVGSITPASVDATWTAFVAAAGCAFDQTDGNPIIYCHTTGKTNNDYFVKLNAATAAVIWACPIANLGTVNPVDLAQALIAHQTFYYLGGSNTLYTINTSTGTATSQVVGNLTATSQISEDIYGSLIGYGSWSEVSTHPQYIGTYMGTGGTHVLTNQWWRYMPNGAITPPTATVPKPGIVSTNRTWSFVLDGHTFYVLDLGTQGTFLFDTVTQSWSEFQTAGGNWNMVNGCMWGQRIVAGDIATSDLWELDPAATKDSAGVYELTHIVTGGLSTRSRTFVSLSALRVTASFGVVDTTGVTFNLRFSDDQGNTWSAYYPITLTAGDFGAELAWTSMGSFMAPGRLFELSDAGGLIRIDGCDAFLDGFDNEAQSQDGSDGS